MTDEGELFVWGDGSKGQLGLGSSIVECDAPRCVWDFAILFQDHIFQQDDGHVDRLWR